MSATDTLKTEMLGHFARKKWFAFGVPAVVLVYLVYVFFAFDIPGLMGRASWDNAQKLVSDSYSYKTHVTRSNQTGDLVVAHEGEKKGRFEDPAMYPAWIDHQGDTTVIDLTNGHLVTYGPEAITYDVPGYGLITAVPSRRGVELTLPTDDVPEWISASKNLVRITTDEGRLTITKAKAETFRYFFGWELFWLPLDSQYNGLGLTGILFGERVNPAVSNFSGAFDEFWHHPMWRHGEVFWAIFETILMAFLGTAGAAIIALPLAFLSAKNFTTSLATRFGVRRVFDFLRGIDSLIWTIILLRAFGPGPLTGSIAILLTDTGTFGKLFSEALENVDDKQIEGVRSTGASPLGRVRFGVIPQITPVLISQCLYYLESNTRSATIVGALVGGGIGLMLREAINTQKDWEEVTYYIVLIILMVMLMDTISGWLRRKLIKGT